MKIKGGMGLVTKAIQGSPYGMVAKAAGVDIGQLSKIATNVGKASIAQSGSGNSIAKLTSGLTGAIASVTQKKSSTQSPSLSQSSALAQLSPNDANNLKKSFTELKRALETVGSALGTSGSGKVAPGTVESGTVASGSVASGSGGANALKTISGLAQSPELQALGKQALSAFSKKNTGTVPEGGAESVPAQANAQANAQAPANAPAPAQANAPATVGANEKVLGGFKRTYKRSKIKKSRKGKSRRKTKRTRKRTRKNKIKKF